MWVGWGGDYYCYEGLVIHMRGASPPLRTAPRRVLCRVVAFVGSGRPSGGARGGDFLGSFCRPDSAAAARGGGRRGELAGLWRQGPARCRFIVTLDAAPCFCTPVMRSNLGQIPRFDRWQWRMWRARCPRWACREAAGGVHPCFRVRGRSAHVGALAGVAGAGLDGLGDG